MSIWTYLAIALMTMEADALAHSAAGERFRVVVSALLALCWPVTAPIVIAGIVWAQCEQFMCMPRTNK